MKNAGVYDRWLHTLGGGENYTVALAQALAKNGYNVEILTHRSVDLELLKSKFGLKTLNFKVRYLPELWDYEMTPYTKEYDLFVLSSFADMFSSLSEKSILSVFFPTTLQLNIQEWLTRVIVVPAFRKLFQFELYSQNNLNMITIATNKSQKEITVELDFPKLALSVIEQIKIKHLDETLNFNSKVLHNKNIVELKIYSKKPIRQWHILLPESEYSKGIQTKVKLSVWNKFGNLAFKLLPKLGQRFLAGPRKFSNSDLASYKIIISISDFTKKWIQKYWNKTSEMLYPPVSIENFYSTEKKQKWIVSTGRFFVGGHNKKQLEMVEAFKKIHKKFPDWELHLIGSVNEGQVHRKYFEKVIAQSKNFPITIHDNIPFSKLREILSKSSIYWHASGLDINESKHPVMMEHFGITVVEAMASGCVPVVIDKGGPSEILTNAKLPLLWKNMDELVEMTTNLINNTKKIEQYREVAIESSKQYSIENFENTLKQIIKKT